MTAAADPRAAVTGARLPEARQGVPRRQAVILTAGRASRIAIVAQNRPKGVIDYAGKPALIHQVLQLCKSGVMRVVIVHAPGAAEQLRGLADRVFGGAGVESVFAEQAVPDGGGGPSSV